MKVDAHASAVVEIDDLKQEGKRSRALLLLERTMYREGLTPFASIFTIKLLGRLEEARLRQALALVQAKHPLLRCVVEERTRGPHFVLQDEAASISLRIVERRGEDDWQFEVRREWVTPFDTQHKPLVRFVWLHAGDVNELIMVAHHCICDGHSGINLLRELLSVYDQPEQQLYSYDALGAVEDLVPAEILQDRHFQRRVHRKLGFFRLAFFLKRFRGSKLVEPQLAPEQMYFHRWHVEEATTFALTERCSAEGVTVLAAASIAFMQAFRDVRGSSALNKTYTMVNARKFLPQLRADAMFGLVPGIPLLMKDLPLPRDISVGSFWSRARAIKADMKLRIDRLGASLYTYLLALENMHDKYASMVGDTESAPAVRHITLSNMGRIDLPQQYQSFRLESVYSPLVMVSPTPANTVVLSSFAGQMEFAIISDDHSLPPKQALAIEQRAMEILQASITVPLRYESRLAGQLSTRRTETT